MAKKTRTELSTLAINTNLPDNTTELITPTTERAQLTDERASVVNYKDDLGGVPNAGKFITVAVDGESLTMVDEPTGELSGTGVTLQVALWDGTKVLTGVAEFIYTNGILELRGISPQLSINASTSGNPILDFQDSGNTKARLFYDTVSGSEKFVIRAIGVDTVFERAVNTPTLTIDGISGDATFSNSSDASVQIGNPGSGDLNAYLKLKANGAGSAYVNSIGTGSLILGANGLASNHLSIASGGVTTINATAANGSNLIVKNLSNDVPYGMSMELPNGSSDSVRYLYYGSVGGTAKFKVATDGTIYAVDTTVRSISDVRFKENIRDLDTGLSQILQLKPRLFDWKEGKGMNIKDAVGFIAQEVEEILPKLVDNNWSEDGLDEKGAVIEGVKYKTVGQSGIIPTLVKGMQEQQTIIESLINRLEALEV